MEKGTWKLPEEWANQKHPVSEKIRMKKLVSKVCISAFIFLTTSLIISLILVRSLNANSDLYSSASTALWLSFIGLFALSFMIPLFYSVVGDDGTVWSNDDK